MAIGSGEIDWRVAVVVFGSEGGALWLRVQPLCHFEVAAQSSEVDWRAAVVVCGGEGGSSFFAQQLHALEVAAGS